MNANDRTAPEALADVRWHLRMASGALTAAGRERPLFSVELDQAREQLQHVAASLPRLER